MTYTRQEFTVRQKDEILQRNMKVNGFPFCEVCKKASGFKIKMDGSVVRRS